MGEASLRHQVYQAHELGLPFPSRAPLCLPPHNWLTPALLIPSASSPQASHNSPCNSSILKWIALPSLGTTSAGSTCPSAPCCRACWGRWLCTFWDLEQASLGVPMSWELSTWRRVVVLRGQSLGWAQGMSQNCAQRSPSFR